MPNGLHGTYVYESVTTWLDRFEENEEFRTFLRKFILNADDAPEEAAVETPAGGPPTPLHGDIADRNDDNGDNDDDYCHSQARTVGTQGTSTNA